MLLQYLVGLLCLRHDPEAVNVTIGDLVFDDGNGKERDVDVTVTVQDHAAVTSAFMAYEVKGHSARLDVKPVEQLILKLNDMQSLTHRAIVSTSGFTDGAIAKAKTHGVNLYELVPWTGNVEEYFPNWDINGPVEEIFRFGQASLTWQTWEMFIVVSGGPNGFSIANQDPILTKAGKPHGQFTDFLTFKREILIRSTEILHPLEPAKTFVNASPRPFEGETFFGEDWSHTHTLDVRSDLAYVQVEGHGLVRLDHVNINGRLRWEFTNELPDYFVMRSVAECDVFAGALVGMGKRAGQMLCFVLSPDPAEAHVHSVQLTDKQLNMIRRLQVERPAPRETEWTPS